MLYFQQKAAIFLCETAAAPDLLLLCDNCILLPMPSASVDNDRPSQVIKFVIIDEIFMWSGVRCVLTVKKASVFFDFAIFVLSIRLALGCPALFLRPCRLTTSPEDQGEVQGLRQQPLAGLTTYVILYLFFFSGKE